MKGWKMYSRIQQLKEDGLNKSQVERKLDIDFKTVMKYWDMTPDEYKQYEQSCRRRKRKLAKYEDFIVLMLKTHSDYTVAQIQDRLQENYPDDSDNIKYSTLRRFVNEIRIRYKIPKEKTMRQYQAVPDPPPGYQAQVDLGVQVLKDITGNLIKLYAIAMVLSNSMFKFAEWFDSPPTTADFISFHDKAFRYLKGMPKEIVYDQDRLLIVNENFGDIIYTADFEIYRQQRKFKTFICRSSDPESKGRIESVVKFLKNNFAKYRVFTNIQEFNQECLEWLERTGNAKRHGTTKKVPAEAFSKEQKYLRPVPETKYLKPTTNSITRKVRKDNTIIYLTNRYTVPLGTYEPDKEVYVKANKESLQIIDKETGELVATHKVSLKKGQLIQNNNHLRDHSDKIDKLYQKTLEIMGDNELNRQFLKDIHRDKPRYIRDQYSLLMKLSKDLSQPEINKAVDYCLENQFYSATVYGSVIENLDKLPDKDEQPSVSVDIPSTSGRPYEAITEVRDLSEYELYAR